MITIFDKNDTAYFIRPCPLISITWNTNFTQDGQLGGKYDITLTGSLLSHVGSPIYPVKKNNTGNYTDPSTFATSYTQNTSDQTSDDQMGLGSLLSKQIALRELFSKTCVKVEVASVADAQTEPLITFYPKFVSINFTEGVWVDKCDYSITLEAEFLLDNNEKVIGSESYASKTFKPGDTDWVEGERIELNVLLDKIGGFIEDFQESWSIEPEDGNGNTVDPSDGENIIRVYRLSRSLSAKGKDISKYQCFGTYPPEYYKPHEQARRYIINHIQGSGTTSNHDDDYPSAFPPTLGSYYASGLLNLSVGANGYRGYNHSRSENVDITQGTYSVQDSWILSSGASYENYNLSYSTGLDSSRNVVSIQGTIKGLTSIPGSGSIFGGNCVPNDNTPYENAINKYREITNSGEFGGDAHTFKRANNAVGAAITLNPKPASVALSTNEFTGEINYTIEYDDRSSSSISGVISQSINVSDTYPGDVFAVIPVIGRPTGPVIQYIGGRTEYQRSLSMELVVTKPSGIGRSVLLSKPSLVEPTRTQIRNIILDYSPLNETGIRKYFVNPPQETWDPQEGRYSLNITWVYELNN